MSYAPTMYMCTHSGRTNQQRSTGYRATATEKISKNEIKYYECCVFMFWRQKLQLLAHAHALICVESCERTESWDVYISIL